MDKEQINRLLDKYWACATSVEEERELRYFFSSGRPVPPELRPFEAWFRSAEAETLSPLGPDFDCQVLVRIRRRQKSRYRIYKRIGVAAAVLVVLSAIAWLALYIFGVSGFIGAGGGANASIR